MELLRSREIAVSIRSLHALTSSGRMDVLRCLKARRMTAAEVAAKLAIQKSSAHKHLTRLAQAGFVLRHQDDRVWVYYSLTGEGRHLVESERPRLILLLGLTALAFTAVLAYVVVLMRRHFFHEPPGSWGVDPIMLDEPAPPSVQLAVAVLLAVAALALVIASARRLRRQFG